MFLSFLFLNFRYLDKQKNLFSETDYVVAAQMN